MDTTGGAVDHDPILKRGIPTIADDARSIRAGSRRRRRRGRTRRKLAAAAASAGAVVLGGILGLSLAILLVAVFLLGFRPGHAEPGRRDGPQVAREVKHSPASRPVLRFSVVAGGVYDASEV